MTKILFIKTHGCQMNEYDSAKMFDLLEEKENFELAKSEDEADLLILNTCSIREKAQEKVFHQIGRWRKIKEKNPNLKIAIIFKSESVINVAISIIFSLFGSRPVISRSIQIKLSLDCNVFISSYIYLFSVFCSYYEKSSNWASDKVLLK